MWKFLILASLGFLLFYGVPLRPQNAPQTVDHSTNGNDTQRPSQVEIANVEHADQANRESDKKGTSPIKRDYEKLGFYVNLILTLATLVIAVTAAIQASAAKISSTAIMRSERAWLLLEGDKMQPPFLIPAESQVSPQKNPTNCELALRNCGNTPASAIEWQFEMQIGDSAQTPVSFEIYKSKSLKESPTPFPIGQDQPGYAVAALAPREYISISEREEINAGTKTLWLCGVVRYHDIFEQQKRYGWLKRGAETHQTLVCLRYIAYPGNNYGRWVLGGPSGYNRAT